MAFRTIGLIDERMGLSLFRFIGGAGVIPSDFDNDFDSDHR